MAVLVSLERRIALDLRHAFEIIISSDNELCVFYVSGDGVLEEIFPLPSDVHTKGILHFLADFKNTDKVIIYEDLIDGFKTTKEKDEIQKLKAENENLKADNERLRKTVCDLMGNIQSLRERLKEYEDDEEDEIIPVADPGT